MRVRGSLPAPCIALRRLYAAASFHPRTFCRESGIFVGDRLRPVPRRILRSAMPRHRWRLVAGGYPAPLTAGSFRHPASRSVMKSVPTARSGFSKGGHARETRRLRLLIGSGVAGRSFGYLRDGFLFEAPVTWYTQTVRGTSRRDMSPIRSPAGAGRSTHPVFSATPASSLARGHQ